jgi:hypothetical protein
LRGFITEFLEPGDLLEPVHQRPPRANNCWYPSRKRSCAAVSTAPGRALRTRSSACLQPTPNSMSNIPATVPARPRPPRQWTRTLPPDRRWFTALGPTCTHFAKNSAPGAVKSRNGKWCQSMPRRVNASPRVGTRRKSSSCASRRVITMSGRHEWTASTSRSRSRCHLVPCTLLPHFPGQIVIPIRPGAAGLHEAASMRKGSDKLVRRCMRQFRSVSPTRSSCTTQVQKGTSGLSPTNGTAAADLNTKVRRLAGSQHVIPRLQAWRPVGLIGLL